MITQSKKNNIRLKAKEKYKKITHDLKKTKKNLNLIRLIKKIQWHFCLLCKKLKINITENKKEALKEISKEKHKKLK